MTGLRHIQLIPSSGLQVKKRQGTTLVVTHATSDLLNNLLNIIPQVKDRLYSVSSRQ